MSPAYWNTRVRNVWKALHVPQVVARTRAQKVADRLDKSILDADLETAIKDTVDRRDRTATLCEAIIVALVGMIIFVSIYTWLGVSNFKALGIDVVANKTTCFAALVLGNALWVVRTGAFFKVLVLEALFQNLCKRSKTKEFRQILDCHLSNMLFVDAVTEVIKLDGPHAIITKWSKVYIRNGLVNMYSLYFYITLVYFMFFRLGPLESVSHVFMFAVLAIMNLISSVISGTYVQLPRSMSL